MFFFFFHMFFFLSDAARPLWTAPFRAFRFVLRSGVQVECHKNCVTRIFSLSLSLSFPTHLDDRNVFFPTYSNNLQQKWTPFSQYFLFLKFFRDFDSFVYVDFFRLFNFFPFSVVLFWNVSRASNRKKQKTKYIFIKHSKTLWCM